MPFILFSPFLNQLLIKTLLLFDNNVLIEKTAAVEKGEQN